VTELVLRFAGGIQALMGASFAVGALARLNEDRPTDVGGWLQFAIGLALVVAMAIAALRIALGEELGVRRAVALLAGSLLAGLVGLLLVAAA
jgi:hypothetical protein